MDQLTLAAICMNSTADKKRNLDLAETAIRHAAGRGADWVQLPEMFHYLGTYDQAWQMAEVEGGLIYQRLSALALELQIILFAGSYGERADLDNLADQDLLNSAGHKRVYNTSYVFDRSGQCIAKYRKIHLFNLYDEKGDPRYCESDGFIPGNQPVSVEVDGLKVALSICYDLRFPEFYTKLSEGGPVDVINVPSAFTFATGRYHWELLLKARAVERQAYVFAANQGGQHGPGKESWGHGMIIDPWGTTIANTGEQPGLALAQLSRAKLAEYRARLPALANRRPDLYR